MHAGAYNGSTHRNFCSQVVFLLSGNVKGIMIINLIVNQKIVYSPWFVLAQSLAPQLKVKIGPCN